MSGPPLHAPWTGSLSEQQKELCTLQSIQKKNLGEFQNQLQSIVGLITFAFGKISSDKPKHAGGRKHRYQQREKDITDKVSNYNAKYDAFLDEEDQLLSETNNLNVSLQKLLKEEKILQDNRTAFKKAYKDEKCALKEAHKLYQQTFNMDLNVEDSKEDIIKVDACFQGTDASIKFTIDKSNNIIKNFNINSPEELEDLKAEHEEMDGLECLIALRTAAIKKTY